MATLACGLRDNSRIKMRISGASVPIETLLLAAMTDQLSFQSWAQTKDGQNGINRPKSMLQMFITEKDETENNVLSFDTAEEFERMRNRILGKEG